MCAGGPIAASWAVLRCMGKEGYTDVARKLMEVADIMKTGINLIEVCVLLTTSPPPPSPSSSPSSPHSTFSSLQGLSVCGNPHMTIFSFKSDSPAVSIFALADVMETKGVAVPQRHRP